MFETIVALATPKIKSALAIIRLSGDDCFKIIEKIFSSKLDLTKKRNIHFGYIKNKEKEIDQVVLLTYVAPFSFTGENVVEIMCHGSMVVVNEIITLILSFGARLANHGEFSSRAFLNHKIDLIQAEAINDLINAQTNESKDFSLLALKGENSKVFLPIKVEIADILSQIEVNIDYPEYDDIEVVSRQKVIDVCSKIVDKLSVLIRQGEKDKIFRDGINVAIVGKPNVGKSSLLNAMLHEEKAIVTPIAGTTRDIVEGDTSISGVPIHLFDTAGLHESNDLIENIGINKAKQYIQKADLIIFVIDESGVDEDLHALIKEKTYIVVYNKTDLLKKHNDNYVYISAKNNDIQPLINKIKEKLNIDNVSIHPSFNNERQLGILKSMVSNLSLAIKDAKEEQPIDLVSASILLAYNSALDLLGESNKNDLTEEIFSRFCVGK